MIDFFLSAGKTRMLAVAAWLIALVAAMDWGIGNTVSLGVLYILPMMLGAFVLRPFETAALAAVCALLRLRFDVPSTHAEAALRLVFAFLSYFMSGLFVTALVRNRHLVAENLGRIQKEQALRQEAEEQLRVLVASSPAAILTLNRKGMVVAANHAADNLFAIPEGQTLLGRGISEYLPVLSDALQLEGVPEGFRTAAQCQARRANGEIFLAHTWFSSYSAAEGTRVAAIVVDSSEEMRDREEQNLRQLLKSNRIMAAAGSHELRNLCGAVALVCSHLEEKHGLGQDEDFQGLASLVKGFEKLASRKLHALTGDAADLEEVFLKRVLDDLRIVIESEWREIDGVVRWNLPEKVPAVVADRHGLLQALLNLAQNSHRAVQEGSVRELDITVSEQDGKALIRFQDSGPGVASPERLFEPFQQGADGTGLGLYVSRAVVRSYGGELRFEAQAEGSCFVIELQMV